MTTTPLKITTPVKSSTEFLVKGGAGDQKNVVMAALKDGSYVATWVVDLGIVGQRFNVDGSKVGLEFMLGKVDKYQNNQSVQALTDGGFVVLWAKNQNEPEVYVQRFDSFFNKAGLPIKVTGSANNVYYNNSPVGITVLKNGNFICLWHEKNSYGSMLAKIYNSTGTAIGEEFSIASKISVDESEIITLENGGFAVNFGNVIQIYDDTGSKVGNSFQMNTYDGGIESPKMASLKDGGFITTWKNNNQDGNNGGIFAQRFDAYGNMVSTEFRVNTYTKYDQSMPDIVGLDDGGFLITWQSYLQEDLVTNGLKGYGVFGQRYNADNLPVGNEFQVNTYTDNDQANPNVISLADGSVVMSWESTRQNGATDIDIYAQHFETGIAKTTTDKPALTVKDTTIKVPSIISFEGTSQDDSLQGDEGNNTILGLAGNDILNGGDGDDIIKGGAGKDVLNGGVGVDILIGGAGADVFKFTNIKELGSTEETADVVVDFNIKQKDKIDLSGIDANEDIAGDQVFKLVNLFSEDDATGQLVFDVKTQMIYGSTNADVSPELAIQVNGITSFTATGFIL